MSRLWLTLVAAPIALACGPLAASASAEGPLLTLSSPVSGSLSNQRTLTFAGSTSDSADPVSIDVYEGIGRNGTPIQVSTQPAEGAWSTPVALPADGVYTAVAEQMEAATHEVGSSAEASFTIDATPPKLSLEAIASPTRSLSVKLSGKGGESVGEASEDGPVTVVVEGPSAAASSEASVAVSGGGWELTTTLPEDGSYAVRVSQEDRAGNRTERTATFLSDKTPPQVTLAPLPAVVGSSSLSFSGAAGTAAEDRSLVKVKIYSGTAASGVVVESAQTTASAGAWSLTASKSLPDGTYTAIAEQFDQAENKGQSAPSTFTIKTKGPAVSLNPFDAMWTNNSSPSFGGGLGEAHGDLPQVLLEIYAGTAVSGTAVRAINATRVGAAWTAGPLAEALPDGTYTAVAKQRDEANNVGLSIERTFIVDTVAPQPTLSVPPTGSTGLETVSGTAGIAPGDRKQVTAELFQGPSAEPGQALEAITVNATSEGAWSATFAGLSGGEYSVIARQSDEAGNSAQSAPQGFTVTAPPPSPPAAPVAPAPPVASFTWVPATPAVGQTVSLASNSTGVSSPLSGFGWDVGTGQFAPGGPSTTTTFATPGAHVVRLQVSDANGLSGIATRTINVTAQALKLMQPFPIVRIAGSETASGARVRLLTVQAPPTTKVAISCKGRGCKTKAESRVATASSKSRSKAGAIMLAFPRFQRALQAGAVLQIRVSKAGEIGKFTSFTIRRNKLPVRFDACLRPASSSPSPCPSQ
jgi:Bacterial Ig-like domain/PKD domain